MSRKKENFLDYIPRANRLYPSVKNSAGHVEIQVEHRGFANFLAQKLFRKPRVSRIELDDFGSFVYLQIDGRKSVYEIAQAVKEKFGEKAEPLYARLSRFIKILHDEHYIVYENKIEKK
uniref:PqqD family protein n=1 Tax=Eubacterium cellulosolvens TaxID=29322 RepID=UPI000488EF74|nr:PqqD family protein [[Eubacterium] cellulosolvens]